MTPLPLLTAVGRIATETYHEFGIFQPDRPVSALESRYADEASEFVEIDDARIHYRDEGNPDGPTILALHGTYSSLHTWDGWVEELADEFRIVRIDMPGFGLTGPRREGRQTLENLVEFAGAFADELDLSDITVAGNSLGGGVAWRLAHDRPDLVSNLILINAGGATLLSTLFDSAWLSSSSLVPRYLTPRMFIRFMLINAYADNSKLSTDLVRRYHDLICRDGNRGAVMALSRNYKADHFDADTHELVDPDLPPVPSIRHPKTEVWDEYDIGNVTVPTLFQWGEEDSWLNTEFGRELAAKMDDAWFIAYQNVGHVAMEEAPAETAADAAAFILRVREDHSVAGEA